MTDAPRIYARGYCSVCECLFSTYTPKGQSQPHVVRHTRWIGLWKSEKCPGSNKPASFIPAQGKSQ